MLEPKKPNFNFLESNKVLEGWRDSDIHEK